MTSPEVGMGTVEIVPDQIFHGLPSLWPCLQWHGAEVKRVPEGAVRLASSSACAIQAQRWGNCAYGLQFHVELTRTTTSEWGNLPEYKMALERVRGPGALEVLAAEVEEQFAGLYGAAQTIFSNFIDIAEQALAPI